MENIRSLIAISAVLITAIVSCSCSSDHEKKSEAEITRQTKSSAAVLLPAFKMTDVNGNITNMASFKGKKVFVNLWATWCPPCRAEIPSIEKLQSKLDKQKVAFVMLSLDENFELPKNFAIKHKMQLPVYYPAEGLPAIFKTEGIPATFIFNEKGELIKANNGMDDYDTDGYVQLLKS
jgi:thiol-disulfide isomerase/thioredoxin